jgi:adenylate cyclase
VTLALAWLTALNRPSLTLATTGLVLGLFLAGVPILDDVERRTYDLRFLSRDVRTPSPAVVLAVIDEKSLEHEGRWPWPRSRIARLVDLLSESGARVIAFDIGFHEPDESSALQLIDHLRGQVRVLGVRHPGLDAYLAESRARADNDQALARAISTSSAAVVLGYFFHMSESDLDFAIDAGEIERRLGVIAGSKYPLVLYRPGSPERLPVPRAYAPEPDLPVLAEAADSSGYFTFRPDPDGVIRWIPLVIEGGEELFPPLSLLAAWHHLGRPKLVVRTGPDGIEGVQLGDRLIPTDRGGRLLIDYAGPPKTFPHVSVSDVLRGNVAADVFRDRIVLVGATATGLYDVRSTPFSPVFPGTEINASVIDNLLRGEFMDRPPWATLYDVCAIVVLIGLVGFALPRVGAVPALAIVGGLFVLHVLVAYELFARYGVWLNVVYPALGLAVGYTTLTLYDYARERRERRKIRDAFGHYVAPVVVQEMLGQPGKLSLGGQEKVLTVLFSDLKGFSAYSERYAPAELFALLSEYNARMTERIFDRDGMLLDYVADEIVALFGAPVERADHAVRACFAALEMRERRRAMCEEWVAAGRPPLLARTGINTGVMLVGNLGSEYRFSYGILGDNVNLGSRLEGLNKEYGTEILIGEQTAEQIGKAFQLREVDVVRVVGKTRPTRVYELVAAADTELPAQHEAALRSYASALAAYRAQRWDEARAGFEDALARWPEDGPSRTMLRRCQLYREQPPPEDWDGVFGSTRK